MDYGWMDGWMDEEGERVMRKVTDKRANAQMDQLRTEATI